MIRTVLMLSVLGATLTGCSALKRSAGCSAEASQEALLAVLGDSILKSVREDAERTYGQTLSPSKVRAALAEVKFEIEDIRTSKADPNSSQQFCQGTLRTTFPNEVINEAGQVMEMAEAPTIEQRMDQSEIDRQANAFRIPLQFAVQPTDDGSKIFAEVEDGNVAPPFVSAILAAHLVRNPLRNARREADEQAAIQQVQQQAALGEQKQAAFEEASAERKLAIQTLNTVWAMLPSERRKAMLSMQRAWVRRKGADCRLEAAQLSTDAMERETARLRCEARMDTGRANEFRPFLDQIG